MESFSAILLFSATILALIFANSPYSEVYKSIWEYKIGIESSNFTLVKPLSLWINDGLMAIFFFVIGLEIKRELLVGELNSIKKAILPFFLAIGGMIFPVLIYFLLNDDFNTSQGWAIPMATDIAFSLAVLTLLGSRIPANLKVLLTAFAIVDDLGAVVIIAIFYSTGISWNLLLIALSLILFLSLLSNFNKFSKYLWIIVGVVIWVLFLKSGIHPTIAGVLIALTVPMNRKVNVDEFSSQLKSISSKIDGIKCSKNTLLTHEHIEELDNIEDLISDVQSPLQHLEHKMHNWVAYFIMPVFAFANAGISIGSSFDIGYALTVAVALFVGNFIGILFMSFLSVKTGISGLPSGVKFKHIIGVSFLAGIGFTMSIFIANLAFDRESIFLQSAILGILIGSSLSGLIGYLYLRFVK
ncbi:MAG: Na+/H+ antiporter NhaA [Saprospiraceae bacterium]